MQARRFRRSWPCPVPDAAVFCLEEKLSGRLRRPRADDHQKLGVLPDLRCDETAIGCRRKHPPSRQERDAESVEVRFLDRVGWLRANDDPGARRNHTGGRREQRVARGVGARGATVERCAGVLEDPRARRQARDCEADEQRRPGQGSNDSLQGDRRKLETRNSELVTGL